MRSNHSSHRKSRLAAGLEYHLLRGLLLLLQKLPFRWSRSICRGICHAILKILPKRRRLILTQLRASFPKESESSLEALADASINSLGDGVATFARIPLWNGQDMDDRILVEGSEHVEAALRRQRGVITFTAHYGSWEWMGVCVTRLFPPVSMLVRPLDNPRLDDMVSGVRRSGGGQVIDSRRVFPDGIRTLRANGVLGILVDQNFYKGGVFVDFFGRPAATSPLVPILARRTGCAVIPVHNVWQGQKLRIICEPALVLSEHSDQATAIAEDVQQVTSVVERWVREDPRQWLWLHNRWKRKPTPGERLFHHGAWTPAPAEYA